jgi:hypothetical protein
MKMKNLYLIIVFLFGINLQAQTNTLQLKNAEIQIGIDYKSKNYLVFDGFDTFHKKSFQSNEWQTIKYKFNQLPITNDYSYNFFHIKGKNYLVNKGCGEVYEFRNDSIIRIDNSFQHKNQFASNSFVYKDEIYYFGGYGLFTFKNILTKFDFKTKEWELLKYKDYNKIPEPRQAALSFLKDDFLYIVSGYSEDYETNQTTGNSIKLTDVWKLNLKTMIWDFVGNINSQKELLYNFSGLASYQTNNQLIYDNNRLFEFDFENNTLKLSEPKDKYMLSFNERYNKENNEIIYAVKSTDESLNNIQIVVEPFKNYSGTMSKTETLVSSYNTFYISSIIAILLFAICLLYFKKRKKSTNEKNCIVFKDNIFSHKNKQLNNLSLDETELLTFFFKNYNNSLQMNEVVDFFSKNDTTNYNTLTKKKDNVLNSLKQKLAFVLDINEDDLFIYQKNNEDKRIKEIQLNPRYFIIEL